MKFNNEWYIYVTSNEDHLFSMLFHLYVKVLVNWNWIDTKYAWGSMHYYGNASTIRRKLFKYNIQMVVCFSLLGL